MGDHAHGTLAYGVSFDENELEEQLMVSEKLTDFQKEWLTEKIEDEGSFGIQELILLYQGIDETWTEEQQYLSWEYVQRFPVTLHMHGTWELDTYVVGVGEYWTVEYGYVQTVPRELDVGDEHRVFLEKFLKGLGVESMPARWYLMADWS